MIDFKALSAPFPPNEIEWRIGATSGDRGLPLAYLTARHVMDRLDAVCGPANWQCRYPTLGHVTICEIGVRIENEWIWKADGAGASDVEAEKGILSDALKRAGYRWGIGRYLYDVNAPWVEIEKRGKTSVIAKHEYARLEKILQQAAGGASLPSAPVLLDVHGQPHKAAMAEQADVRRIANLPPAEPDVEDAAKRWVAQQVALLNGYTKDADIFEWDDKNERALHKLKLQHRDLWDELSQVPPTGPRNP